MERKIHSMRIFCMVMLGILIVLSIIIGKTRTKLNIITGVVFFLLFFILMIILLRIDNKEAERD